MGDEGGGSLISLDGVAPSWIVSLSASDIFPCTIKFRRRFLLAPAHPGSPRKRAVKWLCVCVDVHACVSAMWVTSAFASSIPTIFMPDSLPAGTLSIYPSLGQALSYTVLHTQWHG